VSAGPRDAVSGTVGLVSDGTGFDYHGAMGRQGPLRRDEAQSALAHAGELMASADFIDAARLYQRVVGIDDARLTTAAMIGLGEAYHRLDDDAQALAEWEGATRLPENEHTYAAWRNVAAARVRAGNLRGALDAYKEADRRAPHEDKGEIANRMGWLSKELGDKGASGRYFAKARGDAGVSFALGVIAVTVAISLFCDYAGDPGQQLGELLALIKPLVAVGEVWRLVTVVLVHGGLIHLGLNMYALWLVGPFVEQLYGRSRFLLFYIVTAVGASLTSFAFSDSPASVGASGAIMGMFGVLITAEFVHRPMMGRQSRGMVGQLVGMAAITLLYGVVSPGIDNLAHAGGLATGLALGALFAPVAVPSMRSLWLRPGATPGTTVPAFGNTGTKAVRVVGVLILAAAFWGLWVLGLAAWS
jgi:membrane associated rhomboid family serine protease